MVSQQRLSGRGRRRRPSLSNRRLQCLQSASAHQRNSERRVPFFAARTQVSSLDRTFSSMEGYTRARSEAETQRSIPRRSGKKQLSVDGDIPKLDLTGLAARKDLLQADGRARTGQVRLLFAFAYESPLAKGSRRLRDATGAMTLIREIWQSPRRCHNTNSVPRLGRCVVLGLSVTFWPQVWRGGPPAAGLCGLILAMTRYRFSSGAGRHES
jgi:hypothetical protein